MPSVYVSSSSTLRGRFIRFGGGGINSVSVRRRTKALDDADDDEDGAAAMVLSQVAPHYAMLQRRPLVLWACKNQVASQAFWKWASFDKADTRLLQARALSNDKRQRLTQLHQSDSSKPTYVEHHGFKWLIMALHSQMVTLCWTSKTVKMSQ